MNRCVALLLASLALPPLVGQSTLSVPSAFPTIQSAIQFAGPGDDVLVAPGIYNEAIDFLGKAISVRAAQGAQQTVINGGSAVAATSGRRPRAAEISHRASISSL